VTAVDTNPALLVAMKERYGVPGFDSLEGALSAALYDAAVICTPAPLHLPVALSLLGAGLHLFIEKPLAIDDKLVPQVREAIARAGRFVAIAYVYHLMPWIAEARAFLREGSLGKCLHMVSTGGQHFPTFRPAYRDIYYARHDQGGGCVQDALTHVVNAVEWLIGPTNRVFCDAGHQALEGVTVEDTVNVCARHGDILVNYAMNQFQAPNESTLVIHCETGSVKIEVHQQRWGVMRRGEKDWTWHVQPPMERDDLFMAQANAFLDGVDGQPTPLCTFEEAVQTLHFNQAALRSISTGLPITIA
jgi:predicted dehydrogenase